MAARQDGVLSLGDLRRFGVPARTHSSWVERGLLVRLGPTSFAVVGAPPSWRRDLRAAVVDVAPDGAAGGRSAARLLGLDGFGDDERIELLVGRPQRNLRSPHRLRSSSERLGSGDIVVVDALVDSGGESALERRFLALVRTAGLPRPTLQRRFAAGGRLLARVDASFGDQLLVELAGHATHSSRQQRQHDEQRRTALTLQGRRLLTFTYDDVFRRPAWVAAALTSALTAFGVTDSA